MKINELIASPSELTDTAASKSAVVLMTRIRLARNLADFPFTSRASDAEKLEIGKGRVVKQGDTLELIASTYGAPAEVAEHLLAGAPAWRRAATGPPPWSSGSPKTAGRYSVIA